MIKEIVYTGLGVAVVMKEKVEEEIKKLEESGKLKTDDAKSFLDSIEEKGRKEDKRFKKKLKGVIKEIIDELGIATKEDINALKKELT